MKCRIKFLSLVMELVFCDELSTWDDWFDGLKSLSSLKLSDLGELGTPSSACFAGFDLAEPSAE